MKATHGEMKSSAKSRAELTLALEECRERLRRFVQQIQADPFDRVIKIYPAWDKPNLRACRLFMALVRGNTAASVTFQTDWHRDEHREEISDADDFRLSCGGSAHHRPTPLSCLGSAYHSPVPQCEGQEVNEFCQWMGRPCYCDMYTEDSDEYEQLMLTGGTDALWARLEADWNKGFTESVQSVQPV